MSTFLPPTVCIGWCRIAINSQGLKHLVQRVGAPKELNLSCCGHLGDGGLDYLTARCSELVTLDLSNCK